MTLIKSISGIRGTIGGTIGENLTPVDVVKFSIFAAQNNRNFKLKTKNIYETVEE